MGAKGVFKVASCIHCGETDPTKFWPKMKTRCRTCHGKDIAQRLRDTRNAAIQLKGGKCERCGYDRCNAALEFHHLDPTQKDPLGLRKTSLKVLMKEVDKCILLCSNCHKEEHVRLRLNT